MYCLLEPTCTFNNSIKYERVIEIQSQKNKVETTDSGAIKKRWEQRIKDEKNSLLKQRVEQPTKIRD